MKIVVLDSFTLNPGDLSWEGLHRLGDVTLYDRTPPEEVASRAAGADIILTNKTPVRKQALDQLPSLRYIGVLATGYDVVDVKAAAARNITVTNVPTYGTESVAQFVFALLLELCHHVQKHSDSVHQGEWARNKDFCYWNHAQTELYGKTLGLIGFGRIGRQVARLASVFGLRVIAYSRTMSAPGPENVEWVSLDELFRMSDIVSLHCPLNERTERIINRDTLSLMKSSAWLINTSRGRLVAEEDLAEALNDGKIGGAAVDVLSTEPPEPNNPLLTAWNCIITPHIAWATKEARGRLLNTAIENLAAFLSGRPCNVVNSVTEQNK